MSTSRVVRTAGFVGLRYPCPNGGVADDRVENARLLQRRDRAFQSLLGFFHSALHAMPQRFAGEVEYDRRFRHRSDPETEIVRELYGQVTRWHG